MEISRKPAYALRMLAELVRSPDCVVSVRTAAEENGVPYSFARSIQHDLALAGIVESLRGARGGMKLAVDPKKTTLLQLVEAMRFFASRMKLIVEPTGCLGLAAARTLPEALRGQRVGVVISGGNVDLQRFCALTGNGGC